MQSIMGVNQVEKSKDSRPASWYSTPLVFYAVTASVFLVLFFNKSRKFLKLFESLWSIDARMFNNSSLQLSYLKLRRNRDEMSSDELHSWSGSRSEDRSEQAGFCSFLVFNQLCSFFPVNQVRVSQELKHTHAEQMNRLNIKHQTECDLLEDLRWATCSILDVSSESDLCCQNSQPVKARLQAQPACWMWT